ncbi:MAG: phage tail protein [Acidobacteria bacterium 13_1_20CM_3_53_8]|nr:MAG: phage tail protein [Acidobacteria bacterium 13_1_20CM_3_53_8]
MSEPYLGMIIIVPYNFAPRGWAFCAGQILPIAQNTALFSLLGTTFGGNGQTTFALPDLRGRYPIGVGQGPGLSNYDLGQVAGKENVTLTVNNLAPHLHTFAQPSANVAADASKPNGNIPANAVQYTAPANANGVMGGGNTGLTGGAAPFDIHPPYLGLNYCIALEGIFPSRN